jgi:ribosome assembly protein YihI (activator of Der GTPase)
MEFSLDDIRRAIKAEKFKPSDLFDLEDLTGDPMVKGYVDVAKKNQYGAGAAHLRRTEEEFEKQKQTWEAKEKGYQERIKKADADNAKARIPELFLAAKKERKLDEKQTKFIELRLKRFVPSDPEKLEKEFSAHLDSELDEMKSLAEALGIKEGDGGKEKEDGKEKGKGGAERGTGGGTVEDKYLDPAQNPFIPKS